MSDSTVKYLDGAGLIHYDTYIKTVIGKKQDKITDIDDIRNNASLGAGIVEKVNGIEAGAEVNKIATISVKSDATTTTELTPTSKAITIDLSGKQDVIEGLDDIKDGAALGKTAVQLPAKDADKTLAYYNIKNAYTKGETDTAIQNAVDGIMGEGEIAQAYDTLKEISDWITGSDAGSTAAGITARISALETGKQDVIGDLDTIRSNASTGAGLETKVNGIETGAQVNVIEAVQVKDGSTTTNLTITGKTVTVDISGKQDVIEGLATIKENAEAGAGLVDKVSGIEAGAQVNVIEHITIDSGSALDVSDKTVNIDLSGKQTKLTDTQLAAVNSGITATDVATYNGYASDISACVKLADMSAYTDDEIDKLLGIGETAES